MLIGVGWSSWHETRALPWVDPWSGSYSYDNNHFYLCWTGSTQVNPSKMRPRPYPGSTFESGFKTMIIIILILMLTRVKGHLHLWPRPCPRLTLESDFKIMIIIIFILMLNRVNWPVTRASTNDSDLNQWPGLCPRSIPELSFKIMIIIIFILICLGWKILELRVLYNDIIGIDNNKYYLYH
jgi:hypothetical protein